MIKLFTFYSKTKTRGKLFPTMFHSDLNKTDAQKQLSWNKRSVEYHIDYKNDTYVHRVLRIRNI